MRDNKIKNYSVRSARRHKAKNKNKAVKRAHAIRVVCADKPMHKVDARRDVRITARRENYINYLMAYSYCRTYSFVDTNTVLL
jgi:hypothetical protein